MHLCDPVSGEFVRAVRTAYMTWHISYKNLSLLAAFDILVAFCTIILAISFILFPSGKGTGLSHFLLYNEQVPLPV
jgi:hypothetical protein